MISPFLLAPAEGWGLGVGGLQSPVWLHCPLRDGHSDTLDIKIRPLFPYKSFLKSWCPRCLNDRLEVDNVTILGTVDPQPPAPSPLQELEGRAISSITHIVLQTPEHFTSLGNSLWYNYGITIRWSCWPHTNLRDVINYVPSFKFVWGQQLHLIVIP